MEDIHYQLKSRRQLWEEKSSREKAGFWLLQGDVGRAVDLMRQDGLDDASIQVEIDRTFVIRKEKSLKSKGYTDDEVQAIIRAGGILGSDNPLKAGYVRASMAWARFLRAKTESLSYKSSTENPNFDFSEMKNKAAIEAKRDGKGVGANMLKNLRLICTITMVLMVLFPPWVGTFSPPGAAVTKTPAGYSLIFAPPHPLRDSSVNGVQLDFGRLLLQLVVVGGIYATLAFSMRSSARESS